METARERKTAAIVLAAGHGKRMQSEVAKQFMELQRKPLLFYSLKAFEESTVDTVVLVTGKEEISYCQKEIVGKFGFQKVSQITAGGKERYHSVYAGLLALSENGFPPDGLVLIHDGARPLVTGEIISRAVEGAAKYGACAAAMPVKDTIKVADEDGFCAATPKRSTLWQMQTPQAFSFALILDAYKRLFSGEEYQKDVTDDAMVVETMTDSRVKLILGDYSNMKVTTPEDMAVAEALLLRQNSM